MTRRVRFYPVICLAVAALLMVLVCPACGNRNEGSDFAFADLTGSEMILGIHYLGHASFLLQFSNGITVLTDYGASRAWGLDSPVYGFDGFLPDVVTLSHEHDDHAGGILPAGIAHHLTGTDSLEIAGLTICPIRVCELDPTRPDNSAFLFTWRGFTILHAGDIQAWERNLTDQGVRDRVRESFPEGVDLLLLPIEGRVALIEEAAGFISLVRPRRVIPMHYWSPAYKDEWLGYLEEERTGGEWPAEVVRVDGPSYFFLADEDVRATGTIVISLEPAAFP